MPRCPLCGSAHLVITLHPRRGHCMGCDLEWGLDDLQSLAFEDKTFSATHLPTVAKLHAHATPIPGSLRQKQALANVMHDH